MSMLPAMHDNPDASAVSAQAADASTRFTLEEWQKISGTDPRGDRNGAPHIVYVKARFTLGLMTGLLLGAGGCIAVAVYAIEQA